MEEVRMMGIRPSSSHKVRKAKREESGEIYEYKRGPHEEKYPLHKFALGAGLVFYEKVQAVVASPSSEKVLVFTALQFPDGSWPDNVLWTQEEIAHVSL